MIKFIKTFAFFILMFIAAQRKGFLGGMGKASTDGVPQGQDPLAFAPLRQQDI